MKQIKILQNNNSFIFFIEVTNSKRKVKGKLGLTILKVMFAVSHNSDRSLIVNLVKFCISMLYHYDATRFQQKLNIHPTHFNFDTNFAKKS